MRDKEYYKKILSESEGVNIVPDPERYQMFVRLGRKSCELIYMWMSTRRNA